MACPNGLGVCGHTHAPAGCDAPPPPAATGSSVIVPGALSLWYASTGPAPTAAMNGTVGGAPPAPAVVMALTLNEK